MKAHRHLTVLMQTQLVAGLLMLLSFQELLPMSNCQGTYDVHRRLQQDHVTETSLERSRSRVIFERLLADATQLQDAASIKLQYKLFRLNIQQFGRQFCLSFVYGRGDKLVKKYQVPGTSNKIRFEGPGGMQEDPRYCGVYCTIYAGDLINTGPKEEDVVADISRCVIQLNISIPAGDKPYKGPSATSNPIKLKSVSIVATYVNTPIPSATEKNAYLALAPNLRVPFLNPAGAFTTNLNFTILDSAQVPVINVSHPNAAMINITNPLRTYAGSWRTASWKNILNTNAVSYANQVSSDMLAAS
eukprot:gene5292-5527_t